MACLHPADRRGLGLWVERGCDEERREEEAKGMRTLVCSGLEKVSDLS